MRFLMISAMLLLGAGCAATGGTKRTPALSGLAPATTAPATYQRPCDDVPATRQAAFECDRRSILGMVGEFRVKFAFDETLALKPGYAPKAAQRSGGDEFVFVVEDRGDFIALQHILVAGKGKDAMVIKHWRQDWQYEPKDVLVFRGRNHFELAPVAADRARGAWSQSVYEVDDAPRYAGVGRWDHANGVDAWTSDFTWRPLPRREYTKRNDYQVLGAINRHTLTPGGWMHEQDNAKLLLDANGRTTALVREVGINSYERTTSIDFSPGRAYWEKTHNFWRDVRAAWADAARERKAYDLQHMLDERPRFEALFALADKAGNGETVSRADIDAVLARALAPQDAKATAAAQ
ncbi:MAG TPA: DUF6607 family protein [Tahibacter sp.]|uniref:DUF6607 family protein n=1 Tax=Tahibacter sp. TaxID=2056211 RepID=UPI002CD1F332|nr:DUF6607 family protein [Tahibacter sp.]HSX60289.1 DUF6607 family protein [Tahibacter sp.]